MNDQDLKFTIINGRKIIARAFYLEALLKAHEELVAANIGVAGHLGFVLGAEETSSWRSLALQTQLIAKGLSKTLYSNHRRGVGVDCYPDMIYVERIKPIMVKHGLVNDLGDWDRVHFNWISNLHSWSYAIVNELPGFLNEFSMNTFEGFILQETEHGFPGISGSFAFVEAGKKRHVRKDRLAEFATGMLVRLLAGEHIQAEGVNKAVWDSIPDGDNF